MCDPPELCGGSHAQKSSRSKISLSSFYEGNSSKESYIKEEQRNTSVIICIPSGKLTLLLKMVVYSGFTH